MSIRQKNALKTRQKLLDVTHNLIKSKGFYKLSVEDITREAGVAKGTFYIYFKHKEEIVLEICKNLFKETQLQLDKIKNSDIQEKLCCYFECFIKEVQGYQIHIVREWIKGIVEKNQTGDSMGKIKWNYDIEMLGKILSDAIKNNELIPETPKDLITKIIICELYGMFTCWCMSDGELDPKKMIKDFCAIQIKPIITPYIAKKEKK